MKLTTGQTYSPTEKYRSKVVFGWLDTHHQKVITQLASRRSESRWRSQENVMCGKSIKKLTDKLSSRPGLGGNKLAAEIIDLVNMGPFDVPLWAAMEHRPYSSIKPSNSAESSISNLCTSITYWYQTVERLMTTDVDNFREFTKDDERGIAGASAMLRCSLRNAERASSLPVTTHPFRMDAQEIAQVLLDQCRVATEVKFKRANPELSEYMVQIKYDFDVDYTYPELAKALLQFQHSNEDDFSLLADLSSEVESDGISGFGTILSH